MPTTKTKAHDESSMDILYKRAVIALLAEQRRIHESAIRMYSQYVEDGKVAKSDIIKTVEWHRHVVGFCAAMLRRVRRKRKFAAWVDAQEFTL
jgi:hypothetical protein